MFHCSLLPPYISHHTCIWMCLVLQTYTQCSTWHGNTLLHCSNQLSSVFVETTSWKQRSNSFTRQFTTLVHIKDWTVSVNLSCELRLLWNQLHKIPKPISSCTQEMHLCISKLYYAIHLKQHYCPHTWNINTNNFSMLTRFRSSSSFWFAWFFVSWAFLHTTNDSLSFGT